MLRQGMLHLRGLLWSKKLRHAMLQLQVLQGLLDIRQFGYPRIRIGLDRIGYPLVILCIDRLIYLFYQHNQYIINSINVASIDRSRGRGRGRKNLVD